MLGADAVVLLSDNAGELHAVAGRETVRLQIEPRLAVMAFAGGTPVECDQLAASGFAVLYLPLRAPMRVRGVVAVAPVEGVSIGLLAQRQRLETMASLVAIAVERMHYVLDVAQRT